MRKGVKISSTQGERGIYTTAPSCHGANSSSPRRRFRIAGSCVQNSTASRSDSLPSPITTVNGVDWAASNYAANHTIFGYPGNGTNWTGFVNNDWDNKGRRIQSISDGSSNTVMFGERYAQCSSGGSLWAYRNTDPAVTGPSFPAWARPVAPSADASDAHKTPTAEWRIPGRARPRYRDDMSRLLLSLSTMWVGLVTIVGAATLADGR